MVGSCASNCECYIWRPRSARVTCQALSERWRFYHYKPSVWGFHGACGKDVLIHLVNISCLQLKLNRLYPFLLNEKIIPDVPEASLLWLTLALNMCNYVTHHHVVVQWCHQSDNCNWECADFLENKLSVA